MLTCHLQFFLKQIFWIELNLFMGWPWCNFGSVWERVVPGVTEGNFFGKNLRTGGYWARFQGFPIAKPTRCRQRYIRTVSTLLNVTIYNYCVTTIIVIFGWTQSNGKLMTFFHLRYKMILWFMMLWRWLADIL